MKAVTAGVEGGGQIWEVLWQLLISVQDAGE